MKLFIALCFCLLSIPLSAQTTLRTFTSEDGVFQFKYSPALVHCTLQRAKNGEGGSWVPGDACLSQDGLCDDEDSPAITIVCFAYPKDQFKDKPAFDAAAFFVAQVRAATTLKACFEGSPHWLIEKTEDITIRSVRMKRFTTSDAWMSGGQFGEIYRVFRGSTCYEFGIQWASTSPSVFDPGTIKQFTKRDAAKVSSALQRPIDSFTFLK